MSYRLIFLALTALELSGCADFARWVRQYTYPPEFRYLERDEVRSTIRELALHSRELNNLIKLMRRATGHRQSELKSSRTCEPWSRRLRN